MSQRFYHKPFDGLNTTELYELLALRQEVFIVEQNCPYLDADGKDQHSEHILVYNEENLLLGCARIVPKGISYDDYASIGRVITRESMRGTGLGKKIMQYAVNKCQLLYPNTGIKISAQCYALGFYEGVGFVVVGEEYLEDDIPHKAMVYSA